MTTTTNGTTATVQTLTAEVRVLMVGNRQITLSVVKQLDRVRYEELEPMGRVRSSRRDEVLDQDEARTEVVEGLAHCLDRQKLCAEAEALPLILLAGLR